uniref:NADH-ubiquinone oxidoreductase chain 4 n=1 Tax=Brachydistomum sp. PakPr2 TaxID=2714095 RepID=A0A6H0YBZ2_9TREM|nr:NADH dehydrogenase subunit 4 [Brachydistomum sp. PakPr2]
MSRWSFNWNGWSVSFYIFLIFGTLVCACNYVVGAYCGLSPARVFCLDVVSFYLIVLSVSLCVALVFFVSSLSFFSVVMLLVSAVCSVFCYCCFNAFWFWWLYEAAIVSLIFLLVFESPYPERYVASWYFAGYLLLGSLPMLLCIMYLAVWFGSNYFGNWSLLSILSYKVLLLLSVLFISKIPVFPFHNWLPLVHAEVPFPVSVCLSGYIMKLGLLGLCRLCGRVLPDEVFRIFYLAICLVVSVLFFVSACTELDSKRWLAFMSLAHINISCVCLGIADPGKESLAMLYSLGHGLSSSLVFIMLWVFYDLIGSRSWFVLKSIVSNSVALNLLLVGSMCVVMSVPPTVQFFCEVYSLVKSSEFGVVLFFFLGCYLFLGGVVPLVLLGGLFTRHVSMQVFYDSVVGRAASVFFLLVMCFVMFALA